MKYNSIHRFADMEDARKFTEFIKGNGFKYAGFDKNGGVIFKNEKGYSLMICVQP